MQGYTFSVLSIVLLAVGDVFLELSGFYFLIFSDSCRTYAKRDRLLQDEPENEKRTGSEHACTILSRYFVT